MKNDLIYPFKVMRITQRYDGRTSHLPHMTGTPKEWALDEGEKDTGRGWVYCPCDRMRVTKLTGVGKKGTNAVYLTSTEPVELADGTRDIVTLQLVHPNDDDLKKLRDGQIFTRGGAICREGNDGAHAYHIHMAVGRGKIVGTGWQKNSKGRWVLVTTGGPLKPEDAFFVDPKFTTVVDSAGIRFREVPEKTAGCVFRVTAPLLRVRTGPGTQYAKKPFPALSADAQRQILALTGEKRNGYVRGLQFTARDIQGAWAQTASGWVCLNYCEASA